MGNNAEKQSAHIVCQVDFGAGRQIDVEIAGSEELWVAAGPDIPVAHFWLKQVAGKVDLRVRISRLPDGLQIAIDRGEQEGGWWPKEAGPRLDVTLDENAVIASASASIGSGNQTRIVALGKAAL